MTARWWAFGLWAAVAGSALYWGLRLFVPGTPAPAHAIVAPTTGSPRGDLTRLFGVEVAPVVAEAPPPSSRFQLLGVVAPRGRAGPREGVALIAVDGKPPRAYRVGAAVDGTLVLQSVRARGASLGPQGGAANVTLDIPPPTAAATGSLPSADMPATAAAAPSNVFRQRPPGMLPPGAPRNLAPPAAGPRQAPATVPPAAGEETQ